MYKFKRADHFWYIGEKSKQCTGGMTESLNARVSWRAVTNFIRSFAFLPREHHLLPLPDQASLSWTFLRLFREEHPSRIDLDPQKSLSRPRTGLVSLLSVTPTMAATRQISGFLNSCRLSKQTSWLRTNGSRAITKTGSRRAYSVKQQTASGSRDRSAVGVSNF